MKYKEYVVKFNEERRLGPFARLGILGEEHIYTPEESIFVKKIMPSFDTVAIEGESKQSSSFFWLGLLYLPVMLAYMAGTNRSLNNDTAKQIAEKYGKRIMRLEEDTEQLFPLSQKIALAIVGLTSIPMAPLCYAKLKLYGDPFEVGTKAYEKRIADKKKGKKGLDLFSRLTNFAYMGNIGKRDRIMAERSIDILRRVSDNLLIVCGENHLDGIVKNLHDQLLGRKTPAEFYFRGTSGGRAELLEKAKKMGVDVGINARIES